MERLLGVDVVELPERGREGASEAELQRAPEAVGVGVSEYAVQCDPALRGKGRNESLAA